MPRRVSVGKALGRGADALFSGPAPGTRTEPVQVPPSPAPQPETRQTAVWLSATETDWLDDRVLEAKRAGRRQTTRSSLIRDLIQAAIRQHRDGPTPQDASRPAPR